MSPDLPQLRSDATPTGDGRHVWPAARSEQRDRWARLVGGAIGATFLVVWMVVYWPNVTMRFVSLGLLIAIVWMMAPALFDNPDASPQGRIAIDDEYLQMESHQGDAIVVAWKDVASGQWRQDQPEKLGLWLFDGDGRVLAHLDATLLANQGEARAFVKWAGQLADLPFEIRWTQV